MTDARRIQHLEREIDRLRAEGRPFAVATIVRTVDATSAKPGAKALLLGDGTLVDGWIGGGCARSAVARAAIAAVALGKPQFVSLRPEDLLAAEGVAPGEERDAWQAPVDAEAEKSANRRLAAAIAGEIAALLARGDEVHDKETGKRRAAHAGDIRILVRRRKALFENCAADRLRAGRRRRADRPARRHPHMRHDDIGPDAGHRARLGERGSGRRQVMQHEHHHCSIQGIVIHVTGPGSMAGMRSWFKTAP